MSFNFKVRRIDLANRCTIDVYTYHTMDGPGGGTSRSTEVKQVDCGTKNVEMVRGLPYVVCHKCKDFKLSQAI